MVSSSTARKIQTYRSVERRAAGGMAAPSFRQLAVEVHGVPVAERAALAYALALAHVALDVLRVEVVITGYVQQRGVATRARCMLADW